MWKIIKYSIFSCEGHLVPWSVDTEDCYRDEASAIRYRGSGVRIGEVAEKQRLVYSIVGGPRAVLSLKKGRFRELVFSTRNPEEVMKIIKERTQQS